jgi:hypothetical protein
MSPYGVRHLIVGWPCFRRQLVTWVCVEAPTKTLRYARNGRV